VRDDDIQPYLYFGEGVKRQPQGRFTDRALRGFIPTTVTFTSLH
jgi:hypothetical protein